MNSDVKQRLIGAIVLLIICAFLWPVVFPASEEPELIIESKIPVAPSLEIFELPKNAEPEAVPSAIQILEVARAPAEIEIIDEPIDVSSLDTTSELDTMPEAAQVAIEVKSLPSEPTAGWAIQVGAFSVAHNAQKLADELRAKNYSVVVQKRVRNEQPLFFVYLGPYLSKRQAEKLANKLKQTHTGARLVEFSF